MTVVEDRKEEVRVQKLAFKGTKPPMVGFEGLGKRTRVIAAHALVTKRKKSLDRWIGVPNTG